MSSLRKTLLLITYCLAITCQYSYTLQTDSSSSRKIQSDSTTLSSSASPTPVTTPKSSNTDINEVTPKTTAKPKNNDCPSDCSCSEKEINCEHLRLKTIPNFSKFSSITQINLRDNMITSIDFSQLPLANLERLDLSSNYIKNFPNTSKKLNELPKLSILNLSENQIDNLTKFNNWKFPALELLDLSHNELVDLDQFTFNKTVQLTDLNLAGNPNIKSIHENAFWPLTQLQRLNMSGLRMPFHLGDKQFIKNQKLELLDLTDNQLIEVPFALRGTGSIQRLILNENLMTSLRPSDFVNRSSLIHLEILECKYLTKVDDFTFKDMTNLKYLTLAYNPSLNYISKDAFRSSGMRAVQLVVLDLRGNNLTTMTNPKEFASLSFDALFLQENPWDCTCNLRWVQSLSNNQRSAVHCRTPAKYRDMDTSVFFSTTDCDAEESDYHVIIVTGFILFLLGLFIAIIVQRNESLRRLFWKDQYGTIYYTKASFPQEGV